MDEQKPHNNASRHQVRTLRFIAETRPTLVELRHISNVTLSSLAYNKWIQRASDSTNARVSPTRLGYDILAMYDGIEPNMRREASDLTDRCMRLIQFSRTLSRTA